MQKLFFPPALLVVFSRPWRTKRRRPFRANDVFLYELFLFFRQNGAASGRSPSVVADWLSFPDYGPSFPLRARRRTGLLLDHQQAEILRLPRRGAARRGQDGHTLIKCILIKTRQVPGQTDRLCAY